MSTKWTCIVLIMLGGILVTIVGCSSNAATGNPTNTAAITIVTAARAAAVPPPQATAAEATRTTAADATTVAQPAASGLCDLPYFPIKAGAVWKYHWTAGNTATDETVKVSSVSADSFTRHVTFSNIAASIDERWTCSGQGLTNPQPAAPQMTATAGGSSTQVRTLKHTGISLPAANMWQMGAAWSESADLAMTMTIGNQSGTSIRATTDTTSKIVTQEQVAVPAGTFTALRVDSTEVEHLGNTNVSIPSSSWYAQGVGLVKQTSNAGAGAGITVELLSFTP